MSFCRKKMLLKSYQIAVVSLLLNLSSIFCLTSASGHSNEEMSDSSRIMAVTTGTSSGDLTQKHVQVLAHQSPATGSGSTSNLYGISRPGRHLGIGSSSSLSPTNLLGLGSGTNYGYAVPEYGEHGAASGSYGQNHGYGGAGGWGFAKADCNSALGLLGVLGLISFLQNVLRQMSTTTATPNNGRRKKRSDPANQDLVDHEYDYTNDLHRVTTLILPLLTAVAHARDRFIPTYCTHREICNANSVLTKEFGTTGRSLGSTITDAIVNMLTKDTKFGYKYLESKIMRTAGKSGRNGEKCNIIYKTCPELQWLPTYSIPPTMLWSSYQPNPINVL